MMASLDKSLSEYKLLHHPFLSAEFVDELQEFFRNQPVGMSAAELTEAFSEFSHLPVKWSARKLKIFLTKSQILSYSRKKPAGFSLDNSQIQEYWTSDPLSQKKIHGKSPKESLAEKKRVKKSPSSVKSKGSSSSISEKRSSITTQPQSQAKFQTKSKSKSRSQSQSKSRSQYIIPKSQRSIVHIFPSYPKYLLGRMPKQAQKVLNLGVAQIQAMSLKKLDEAIEYLTASKMFFDGAFENERKLMQSLDDRVGYMSKLSEEIHEQRATRAFDKYFYDMYDNAKFAKIIKKWGTHYDAEQCAYLCWKKMGKKANKISISEYALRKMIKAVLLEKHPEKA
ncbi:MAG: hypothetical protein ACTSYI_01330 [Promethearchaeota archaeon]